MAQVARVMDNKVNPVPNESAAAYAASIVGVSKRFGKTSVLQNITFHVAEGEALVLLGASGSGKTTILRIIAGLEQPYTGQIILHNKDVTELPARERGVGFVESQGVHSETRGALTRGYLGGTMFELVHHER